MKKDFQLFIYTIYFKGRNFRGQRVSLRRKEYEKSTSSLKRSLNVMKLNY